MICPPAASTAPTGTPPPSRPIRACCRASAIISRSVWSACPYPMAAYVTWSVLSLFQAPRHTGARAGRRGRVQRAASGLGEAELARDLAAGHVQLVVHDLHPVHAGQAERLPDQGLGRRRGQTAARVRAAHPVADLETAGAAPGDQADAADQGARGHDGVVV